MAGGKRGLRKSEKRRREEARLAAESSQVGNASPSAGDSISSDLGNDADSNLSEVAEEAPVPAPSPGEHLEDEVTNTQVVSSENPVETSVTPSESGPGERSDSPKGLEKEHNIPEGESSSLQSENEKLHSKIEILSHELKEQTTLLSQAEENIYKLETEKEEMEKTSMIKEKAWKNALMARDNRLDDLEQKMASKISSEDLKQVDTNDKTLRDEIKSLNVRLEEFVKEKEVDRAEWDDLKKKYEETSTINAELIERNNSLQNEMQQLQQDFDILKESASKVADADLKARQDLLAKPSLISFEKMRQDSKELKRIKRDISPKGDETGGPPKNLGQELIGKDQDMDEGEKECDKESENSNSTAETITPSPKKVPGVSRSTQTSSIDQPEDVTTQKHVKDNVAFQISYIRSDRSKQIKKGQMTWGALHWVLIAAMIMLLICAAFCIYHGLQARAERAMWLAANDTSRRALIYYREAAGRGVRVPWMTAEGIQQMKTGYGGGIRRGLTEW